ncbi:glycoside hydrolase [Rhizodiscina lignyota]|uniref:Glycoside hydrolase n=1 Tax=Rhizodiscina lignyota TaxID=1504668 RepID=A0A9P4IBS8_9PEZI|nr:glycoside hydrolase [Rhizodiscina lignyota]
MRLLLILSALLGCILAPFALFNLFFRDGFPVVTNGREILDARNRSVHLKSVNWYGASDVKFVVAGLATRHRDDIAKTIRRMGFNSVRLPYSDELVYTNPPIPADELAANQDLIGHSALDVYTSVINSLTDAGLLVIPNNHITQATWCCGANLCDTAWSNDWLGPICRVKQTEKTWIENWRKVMEPLAHNSLVIGADLRNEVRGPWGTMHWSRWATAAEKAAEALLDINPEWLMFIEGISSANDLEGVRKRPVTLSVPERVVYSAHVYCWSGWGALQPYARRTYQSFAKDMRKNWAYLLESDIAPVWVGEMGTADWPSKGDLNYWQHLVQFLDEVDSGWAYWALNPRKPAANDWESYGLVNDDWETVRWDFRLDDMVSLGLRPLR